MSSAMSDALFGREAELRQIYDLIEGTREAGAALVVRGDAWIGKSALLLKAAERARTLGFGVLWVSGVSYDDQRAFSTADHVPTDGEHVQHALGAVGVTAVAAVD